MVEEKVTFFFPGFSSKHRVENLRLEDYDFFCRWEDLTRNIWLIQTFLRLKRLNHNVHISDQWPDSGIVVLLSDKESLKILEKNLPLSNKDLIVVTVRADEIQWRPMLADIEIVQNGLFANNSDCIFIPHWPQPGIKKRNPERAHKINNLVFKGGRGSLDKLFFTDRWLSELKARDINFLLNTEQTTTNWTDYSEADLVLAVRPLFGDKFKRSDKPASKLVNSWHAEVPSLLGPEFAFRELKESELDYVEVENIEDALIGIDRLRSDESLYFRMIENGKERARKFTAKTITKKWEELLFEKIPLLRDELSFKRSRIFSGRNRKLYYFFTKRQTAFENTRRIGSIYRNFKYSLEKTPHYD